MKWVSMREGMEYVDLTLGMAAGSQPHRRCNPCKTCGYATTPIRVYTTSGVLLALATFTAALVTVLDVHQPPQADLIKSKKKCFSIALRHTLVVLEMH